MLQPPWQSPHLPSELRRSLGGITTGYRNYEFPMLHDRIDTTSLKRKTATEIEKKERYQTKEKNEVTEGYVFEPTLRPGK